MQYEFWSNVHPNTTHYGLYAMDFGIILIVILYTLVVGLLFILILYTQVSFPSFF